MRSSIVNELPPKPRIRNKDHGGRDHKDIPVSSPVHCPGITAYSDNAEIHLTSRLENTQEVES